MLMTQRAPMLVLPSSCTPGSTTVSSPPTTSGSINTVSGSWMVTPASISSARFHSRKMRSTSARSARVLQPSTSRESAATCASTVSPLPQHGNGIGEIKLAMLVVGLHLGQRGPQFFEREAVDGGIDFVNLAIGRRSIAILRRWRKWRCRIFAEFCRIRRARQPRR